MTEPESREGAAGAVPAGPGGAYPEFAPYPAANTEPEPEHTAASPSASQNESAVSENTASEPESESTPKETAASAQPAPVPGFELQSDPAATAPTLADPNMFAAPDPSAVAVPPEKPAPPQDPAYAYAYAYGEGEVPGQGEGEGEGEGQGRVKIEGSWLHRTRMGFRQWRRSRPFWGGFFVIFAGGEILFTEKMPFRVLVHFGLMGLAGYMIPAVMVLCGVLVIFNPQQRLFYAILSVLLALATWPTSNLGGFMIGMLFGLIGGSLAFAWMPLSAMPAPKPKAQKSKAPTKRPPKVPAQG